MEFLRGIVSLAMWLIVLAASAQGIEIRGRVTDSDHKPIAYATVRVVGTAVGTTTDDDGKYSFTAHYSDTITVAFSCVGYQSRERSIINADAERGYVLNATLKKAGKRLEEIQVTDYRPRTGAMQNISTQQLQGAKGVSGAAVEELLGTLPGVVLPSELSSQYNVRGGGYDENAVYVNGTEIYRSQLVSTGQQEGLSAINPDMVGSINFSAGGFSSEYDDKMSSVLDITYRRPLPFEASVSAGFMGGGVLLGQSNDKFSQLHGFRFRKNTSVLSALDEKGEYDPTFLDYQLNMLYSPSDRWILRLSANISSNVYKFTPATRETSFGTVNETHNLKVYFDGHEKDRYENWQASIGIGYKFGNAAGLGINVAGSFLNELVTQDISGEYWLDNDDDSNFGTTGIGSVLKHIRDRLKIKVLDGELKGYLGLANHNLTYGLGLRMLRIQERGNEWEARDSAGFTIGNGHGLPLWYSQRTDQSLTTSKMSAFLQDEWKMRLSDDGLLSMNLGVRFSYLDINREFLWSPKLFLSWKPGKYHDWLFRFSVGLYNQSPFYKEFRTTTLVDGEYFTILNRKLKSQQSLQFTIGADKTFRWNNRPFLLTMEAYCKHISNYIPYQIDNMRVVYAGINDGTARVMGVDMRFFGQFVPGADSWISIGVMNARQKSRGVSAPMPTDRRYNLGLFFTDYFPGYQRLKFFLKGILNDGAPVYSPGTYGEKGYFRMPSYKRVDLGASFALVQPLQEGEDRTGVHKIFRSVWLGFDIFNIFDMSNVAGYYWVADINSRQYAVPNYLTGRQFNFTLTMNF